MLKVAYLFYKALLSVISHITEDQANVLLEIVDFFSKKGNLFLDEVPLSPARTIS